VVLVPLAVIHCKRYFSYSCCFTFQSSWDEYFEVLYGNQSQATRRVFFIVGESELSCFVVFLATLWPPFPNQSLNLKRRTRLSKKPYIVYGANEYASDSLQQ
jgi:hypothetical protein